MAKKGMALRFQAVQKDTHPACRPFGGGSITYSF